MSFSFSPYLAKTCWKNKRNASVQSSLLDCDLPCILCFNTALSCSYFDIIKPTTYTITLHFTNKHTAKWIEETVPENWPKHLSISLERTLKTVLYFSLETFGTPAIKMVDRKLSPNFTGASAAKETTQGQVWNAMAFGCVSWGWFELKLGVVTWKVQLGVFCSFCGLDLYGWDMSTIHATLTPGDWEINV